MSGIRPAKLSYTHDAMIDLIIANPAISNNELAVSFGYTPAWCSMIKGSDAFRARLAARRAELVDPQITLSLEEKIRGVSERAVEVLAEKLTAPAVAISDQLAIRAAEFGAKALGVGGHAPAAVVPADHLEQLAKRMIELQQRHRSNRNVEDVPFIESQTHEA